MGEESIPIIHALAVDIWHQHYPDIITLEQIEYMLNKMYSPEALEEQMQEGNMFHLLHLNNEPAAYLSFSHTAPGSYFLHKLYVKTDSHRKGLGRLLLQHLTNLLSSNYDLRLTVNRKNYKAINFYFRQGFVIESIADFNIGSGFFMNDFVMVKSVQSI